MILLGSRLIDTPIMSLQTGMELARTSSAIIDPADLTIHAYNLTGPRLHDGQTILRLADVRELSDIGFIVDSSDEFITPDDVIKIHELYTLGFQLETMPVFSEHKQKLGKIIDYTIDTADFSVQQLTIKRPLLKSFNDSELLVHRSQIVEINPTGIIIKEKASHHTPVIQTIASPGYVNPFRKSTAVEPTERN